jgi:transcriptional regulator with XRE-family HTH domain
VTSLSREFCLKVKAARREAGLSQSFVAAEVGCKQSALSMFEQGDGTKLNDETVKRLATRFHLEELLEKEVSPVSQRVAAQPARLERSSTKGFCPNPHCPSNHRYSVEDRLFAKPDRAAADPLNGTFCAMCGEVLEKKCPNCGAPVHDGAVCTFCGVPYIALD